MPRIRAVAVRTPFGDAQATFAALVAGGAAATPLPKNPLRSLIALATPLLAHGRPDLILLATTKGDLDQWCADLFSATPCGAGGPAWCAQQLGKALGIPAIVVSAACASSTTALGVAARRISAGGAKRILVLAMERPTAFIHDGFSCLRAIDPNGCRPFHADRAGLVPGEALAAVLLDRNGDGPWLSGWGARMDANHLTGPDRNGSGLAAACRQALHRADCTAPALIIAHGTGTRYNDDAESLAYQTLGFDAPVTAFKGLLGHSLGACGLVDVALAYIALYAHRVPGTVGTTTPGCAAAIRLLPPGAHTLGDGAVVVANAGFAGLNAAVVVGGGAPRLLASVTPQCIATIALDHAGWSGHAAGSWSEPTLPGSLPRLGSPEVLGRSDVSWGRLDLASRALVALCTRLPTLPDDTAVVLLSDVGCAASDRLFESGRRDGAPDPQRFTYTLPTTPVGEVSIRLRLRGAGLCLQDASDDHGRMVAADLLADGASAVVVARVEADRPPHLAWAELWTSA